MEEETHQHIIHPLISSSSSSQLQEQEEQQQQQEWQQLNARNLPVTNLGHEMWACLILTVTLSASMTVILSCYGPVDFHLGPSCSRLVQVNSFFVQSIKYEEIDELTHGARLYGFYKTPALDVEIAWTETHDAIVHSGYHQEWEYFLNKGSALNVSYSVKSPTSAPLYLVISQGRDSLFQWTEDPSYPNTTLSWNVIHGDGAIQQDIRSSESYYIAVRSLDTDEMQVQLNFTIKALVYNTETAYYNCSLSHGECSLTVFLSGTIAALVTSPAHAQTNNKWHIKLSYGPRWITFFLGSGFVSIFMVLSFKIFSIFQGDRRNRVDIGTAETRSEQASLLSRKDDDLSSLGSSYDSISTDDEELDKWLGVGFSDGKKLEGDNNSNPQLLCVICLGAPRDCFFLPCCHSATCFTCGTRINEEAGRCPICSRAMKKVRKIIDV